MKQMPLRRRVLVVDDDEQMRQLLVDTLRNGYDVETAEDGAQAWQRVSSDPSRYDLILLDVKMPIMSGVTFLRQLRHDDRTCHLAVVMVTGEDDRRVLLDCLEAGADDYIVKPFMRNELLRRIANTLERVDARHMRAAIEMVGGILHELNQPLQVLRGFSELAREAVEQVDGPSRPRLERSIDGIGEATERLVEVSLRLKQLAQWRTRPYVGHVRILDLDASAPETPPDEE